MGVQEEKLCAHHDFGFFVLWLIQSLVCCMWHAVLAPCGYFSPCKQNTIEPEERLLGEVQVHGIAEVLCNTSLVGKCNLGRGGHGMQPGAHGSPVPSTGLHAIRAHASHDILRHVYCTRAPWHSYRHVQK
eukprot:6486854-Amphidinium_carterae.1